MGRGDPLPRRPRTGRVFAEVRKYWPALPTVPWCPIMPGSALLGPAGTPAADFVVAGPAEHGILGLVELCGIESGLTASWPLADEVARRLDLPDLVDPLA